VKNARIQRLTPFVFAALAAVSLVHAQDLAQQPGGVQPQRPPATRLIPVGTASISGIVTASDTGRPVRNARVSLSGTAGPPRGDGEGGAIPKPAVSPPLANDNIAVSRTTLTNEQGRFTFTSLAAGRYSVSANRDAYLGGGWGQKRAGGPAGSFLLTEGQRLSVSIPLARGGVITGQVFDEDGEPARSVQVQIWRRGITSGVRQFRQVNATTTDDRGVYRAFGLEPGDYRVAALPRNTDAAVAQRALADDAIIQSAIASGQIKAGAAPGYPAYVTAPAANAGVVLAQQGFIPVYAPSTVVADEATTIHVDANSEQGPFSIHLQYVRSASVHGIVSAALPPNTNLRVSLVAESGNATSVTTGQGNEFTLRNVPPGRYRLIAQTVNTPIRPVPGTGQGDLVLTRNTNDAPALWAIEELTVLGQDVEVGVSLRPSRTISGVVVSDASGAAGVQPRQAQLALAPGLNNGVGGAAPQAAIDADGRFTFTGVIPGKYTLRVTPGLMKSSVVEGEDTLDVPFDFSGDHDIADAVVTMMDSSRRTDLWGVVTNAAGKAVGNVTVVIAPTDEHFWTPSSRRIVTMSTDPWGRYKTETLPPGAYAVATVGDLESGGQYETELLRTVTMQGARVTVSEAASTRQDLRVR
jgi:protocatechuate 3,4-dioxygenase beta subunit